MTQLFLTRLLEISLIFVGILWLTLILLVLAHPHPPRLHPDGLGKVDQTTMNKVNSCAGVRRKTEKIR